jgi:ubiquinone/menaquinone biosynthesis C-methylase UbiE
MDDQLEGSPFARSADRLFASSIRPPALCNPNGVRLCACLLRRETVNVGPDPEPAFATDPQTLAYYDRRAGEYDEWYTGEGVFARRDRPGWDDEVAGVIELTGSLSAARTLDVACGTGFLTRHLRGFVVGIDQSPAMVAIAQSRLPDGLAIVGDALHLVVADRAFDRVFTSHFYGHLSPPERRSFLAEARRVAGELVVVDSALRPGAGPGQWQERILNDGSRHRVYKRYFTGEQLAQELDGETLFEGTWFVAARTSW